MNMNILRFKFVTLITALVFSILVIRVTQLIFFQKNLIMASPSVKNQKERGFIIDRNGEKLALSLETYSIYARPNEIENKLKAAKDLGEILGINYEKILEQLNKKKPFVWIKFRRYYPFHHLASHILGFVGIDNNGLEGIEYYFDAFLSPKRMDKKRVGFKGQTRGYSVVLTIDRYVQEVVEEALSNALKSTDAKQVTAIVMKPSTGEILAIANKPDFDPNNFKSYSEKFIRNRAITDAFEPGSTFKIFIASLLMDKHLINTNDTFNCRGFIKIGNTVIHDTVYIRD